MEGKAYYHQRSVSADVLKGRGGGKKRGLLNDRGVSSGKSRLEVTMGLYNYAKREETHLKA